ncbi:MAG: YajQ family cyclic di-GMP-binding protein [Pseudanabaenaceae cyanobacterium SKYGB_i_bin29]|nr:YajQ family cyclic di-GMP-binding protein [Pseudanabaenaceae cyanobacterium SKYG29]MDW8422407.1 YajQ family cyclic di-GMP-binding protein [Pseudanabaenaceae cyanobacterium SKYGB_i_bin29]
MAATYSFDIVSEFDRQELVNALDQTRREVNTRFDLKDTNTTIELEADHLTINTASELTLNSVVDILQTRAVKRGLSLKIFDYGPIESASGNRVRQQIKLKQGIEQELAKKISKLIRDQFKVQVTIQGDALRVSSKSKDDLQSVIQFLKTQDFPVALQFTNYR